MANKASETALLTASREATAYFDRFDKSLLHHAAAHLDADWLLSETSSGHYEHPGGLISDLAPPDATGKYTLLIPKPQPLTSSSDHPKPPQPLNIQELHQVIRELLTGIYVFNQIPSISLESNYDLTTSCHIPSAYSNTLIGDTLVSVDYFIKSLLHGTTVAHKDKRNKLMENWRKFPQASLREEFRRSGMTNLEDDPELGPDIYVEKKKSFIRYPPRCVDTELAHKQLAPRLTPGEELEQQRNHMSRDMFLQFLDKVSIGIVVYQRSIQHLDSTYLLDTASEVVTKVLATKQQDTDQSMLDHLHRYLQKQRMFISNNLRKKQDVAHSLDLLHFISFMVHFLTSLKKNNKIVNICKLAPSRTKDVLQTEHDFPPFLPSPSSRWSPYQLENTCCTMNGGITLLKSQLKSTEVANEMRELVASAKKVLSSASTSRMSSAKVSLARMATLQEINLVALERNLPVCTLNGHSYYILQLEVEPYYPKTPKFPRWVHAMTAELKSQCLKLPSFNDARIQDLLKKPLGLRRASSIKTVNVSLQASIERGLLPSVAALLKRCTQTRLRKPDDRGMTMLHYAAANGRPDIASLLVLAGSSITQPISPHSSAAASNSPSSTAVKRRRSGPSTTTALHLAVRSGCVDTVACLIRYEADICVCDDDGLVPIHLAAAHNYQFIIRYLLNLCPDLIELRASNETAPTPVLLSAQNGCFDSFRCLVELGADLSVTTKGGANVVYLAVLKQHIEILKYLINTASDRVNVWKVISEMLRGEGSEEEAEAASKSLDPLTQWRPEGSKYLLKYGAIPSLVQLLQRASNETLQLLAVQVLANLSNIEVVREAIVKAAAIPHVVKLLHNPTNDRIQSCACLVLSDLASLTHEIQEDIAKAKAIPRLVSLMSSKADDVQMFSCACIGLLASDHPRNQNLIAEANGIPILVSLLKAPLTSLRGCSARALQLVLDGNRTNQLLVLSEGVISSLVPLLRSRDSAIYTNAAGAIEALTLDCEESQRELLSDQVCINLLKRMLKIRKTEVKVCGACALWAIAGGLISNKRLIATHMGLEVLVDMLTIHHEKLDFVCSEALWALATELGDNQRRVTHVGGVKPLVEVLTMPTSQRVCLSVIHTLSALCVKPALVPNQSTQQAIASSRGIVILASIVNTKEEPDIVRVEAACSLAKLVLKNSENDKLLAKNTSFSYQTIFDFLSSSDPMVRLLAGYCLAIMGFNNPHKLEKLKLYGSLDMNMFQSFLQSDNQFYQVYAAFQVVVLSKLISGVKDVNATIQGIKLLVHLLSSDVEQTKVLSAEFLASLSRTGNGIPGALVIAGALDNFLVNLSTGNGPVVESTSVALGYLTFDPMASRLMIGMFRDNPELFLVFKEYFPLIVYSQKFLTTWNHITRGGIPSLSLESKGGPSIFDGYSTAVTPGVGLYRNDSALPGAVSITTVNTVNTSTVDTAKGGGLMSVQTFTTTTGPEALPTAPPTAGDYNTNMPHIRRSSSKHHHNPVSFVPLTSRPMNLLTQRKAALGSSSLSTTTTRFSSARGERGKSAPGGSGRGSSSGGRLLSSPRGKSSSRSRGYTAPGAAGGGGGGDVYTGRKGGRGRGVRGVSGGGGTLRPAGSSNKSSQSARGRAIATTIVTSPS